MIANNQTIVYDIEAQTETPGPDIPNGVRVTNPFDGTATLLPLVPPDFTPEVLVCADRTGDAHEPVVAGGGDGHRKQVFVKDGVRV